MTNKREKISIDLTNIVGGKIPINYKANIFNCLNRCRNCQDDNTCIWYKKDVHELVGQKCMYYLQ